MALNSSRTRPCASYRIPVDIRLLVRAQLAGEAKERGGQVMEQLPAYMGTVLSRYRVTRHEMSLNSKGITSQSLSDSAFSDAAFCVPMSVLMELPASSAEEAVTIAKAILGQIPVRAGALLSRLGIIDAQPQILLSEVERVSK